MAIHFSITFAQRTGDPGSPGVSLERRVFISRVAASDGLSAGRFQRSPAMTCSRCASTMCHESSIHHQSTDYTVDLNDVRLIKSESYHCLICGNYEDAVIVANRAKQADERRLVAEAESIAQCAPLREHAA